MSGDLDQAMAMIEASRAKYLAKARNIARKISVSRARNGENGIVTIDDVRAKMKLPKHINPSLFGAVFREKKQWKQVGLAKTQRAIGHSRLIIQWSLI